MVQNIFGWLALKASLSPFQESEREKSECVYVREREREKERGRERERRERGGGERPNISLLTFHKLFVFNQVFFLSLLNAYNIL